MSKLKYALGAGATSVAMALGVALPVAANQTADCTGGRNTRNECTNVEIDNSEDRSRRLENCSAIIHSNVEQRQETTATDNQSNEGGAVGDGAGGDADAEADSNGRNGGDSDANAEGGDGTGTGVNEQHNDSTTTATGTQVGGVNFSPDCSTTNNHNNVTNNPVREVVREVHHREVVHQMSEAQTAANARTHASASTGSNKRHAGGSGGGAVLSASTHVSASQVEAPVGGVGAGAGGAAGSIAGSLAGLGGSLATLGYGLLQIRKRK